MNEEKCRSCGAPIVWVQSAHTKKWIPLDEPELRVDPDPHGRESIVTDEGRIVRGWTVTPSVPPERVVTGRRSHFASCPNAPDHRKRKR